MTSALIFAAEAPLMQRLFPPMQLAEQMQHTPFLVLGVLMCCLAAAFLALWRAARDYHVFRTLGFYYLLVGSEQFLRYLGGDVPYWSMRAIASGLLVAAAGEAMQVRWRRWILLFWPICLFVSIAVWFPSFSFTHDWPVLVSEIPLAIITVQCLMRGKARDRMIAAAFLFYLLVRLTLSDTFHHLTGMKNYASIGGWQWPYTTCTLTALGAVTLVILVRDLLRDRSEKQRLAAELAASRAVQLMLITDGVVEARSKTGELFGFERSAKLSSNTADAIAQAAQAFGQEDDITVLTVTRQAAMA